MHEAVHRGELPATEARARLARLNGMRIRLLGDGVLRKVAWTIADELGWESTYAAEYVALTRLQADYLVTLDEELARAVQGVVPTAPFDALLVGPAPRVG
jgi:indolepyruvate ferredoxin oxidoreductase alpha subunit